jgi:Double zinc ribbon
MRCSKCGFDNPEGMKFCGQCTTALALICPKCRFENPPGFKFCGQCAAPLDAAASPRAEPEPHEAFTGERHHLTVLFCDLVGSIALAAQLDPEEWRSIVADYHRTASDAIERFGGYVAQYLDDGVMAFFGVSRSPRQRR